VTVKELDTFEHLSQQSHGHVFSHVTFRLDELEQLAASHADVTQTHPDSPDTHPAHSSQ